MKYTVLLDDGAGISIHELARELEQHGFVVDQQLDAIGVIVGRVDDARLPAIKAERGVKAIEKDRDIEPA